MSQIPVLNGQLPQGFCPTTLQETLNAFSAVQYVNLDIVSSITVSSTPPADHTVAWLQLDSMGRPVRLYFFAQGAWLSMHPETPGMIKLWNQTLPNFNTFDGGSAAVISDISGPMWQLASTALDGSGTQVLQAQFPIGVGDFKTNIPASTSGIVNVGANNVTTTGAVGEDKHKLLDTELALHRHYLANSDFGDTATAADLSPTNQMNQGAGGHSGPLDYKLKGSSNPATQGLSSIVGSDTPHNTLPPFYGVYFLQRTNRLFYLIPP